MGNILVVEDIEKMGQMITDYDEIVAGIAYGISSNNEKFCNALGKIVSNIIESK